MTELTWRHALLHGGYKYDFSQITHQLVMNLEGYGDVTTALNSDAMNVTGP